MKKSASIKDVANLAGVSIATVSRYLHGKLNRMSTKTAQQVKNAIDKLNYVPNAAARQLITNKSKTIAIIVVNIADSFSTELFKGASFVLESSGYTTVMLDTNSQQQKEQHLINEVGLNTYDGLILQPLGSDAVTIKNEVKREMPIVILDRKLDYSPWPQVLSDNYSASYNAAKYFQNNGCTEAIVLSSTISVASTRQERLKGIKEVYPQVKVLELEANNSGKHNHAIYHKLGKALTNTNSKTVLFFLEERWFFTFLSALLSDGLISNKNLQISGFADTDLIPTIWPTAKMIMQNPYQIGKKAGQLMLKLLNGDHQAIPPVTIIKTKFN
ncbi:LacI family DNA-binding transcriptional regulator [Lactobacillus sp. ESL0791]|uniref:LacI family DNA-binding transcriptional regulator n=1 Tax=Lactobacillus sp. ESL0791 TaxID=2983234 RepID=UPI0023F94981|nr:LacI family DNA-binding transcriptional regulator [Lactobacillus sp. ESL0791]MDF7637883.1 LacI family DNA-binding transcriptional regulator [Lactobacillus sp. ESL0791]